MILPPPLPYLHPQLPPYPSDQVFRITPSDEKKVLMLKKILGNMKVGVLRSSHTFVSKISTFIEKWLAHTAARLEPSGNQQEQER